MKGLQTPVNSADHQQGNTNASIALVEYDDFECPHCRRAYPLVKRLVEEIGNDIHFVFRNFPLDEIHPNAFTAAITAEAAGRQHKYWEMHDLIFENQDKLSTHFLMSLAGGLGLEPEQFARDIKSPEIQNKVEMDFESGVRSGVNGTPTFFINGSRLLTYDETYASLLNAILQEAGK